MGYARCHQNDEKNRFLCFVAKECSACKAACEAAEQREKV
jgi:hypothetical protein